MSHTELSWHSRAASLLNHAQPNKLLSVKDRSDVAECTDVILAGLTMRLTCFLKLRVEFIVKPSSLIFVR